MNALEERYAIVLYPDRRFLARWLRPLEAAAYVETYNRMLRHTRLRAQMVGEPPEGEPGSGDLVLDGVERSGAESS